MNKGCIVGAHAQTQLTHGFQKWQRFDITHSATDFDDGDIYGFWRFKASTAFDEVLYFVGDVRNDLNRFAQVITAAFFFKHALVNLARGEVVSLLHSGVDETLVVAQI